MKIEIAAASTLTLSIHLPLASARSYSCHPEVSYLIGVLALLGNGLRVTRVYKFASCHSASYFQPTRGSVNIKASCAIMPEFLELPQEILDQIIDDTIPETVEAFSKSCTYINRLAKSRLEHHIADVGSYCDILITKSRSNDLLRRHKASPLEFLKDFLQKPYLVRYPQQLWLGGGYRNDGSPRPTYSAELRNQIVGALIDCWYVPFDEVQEWATQICLGDYDAGTALLLALLPNLQCFVIETSCIQTDYVRRMLFLIAEASYDPRFTGRCLALSKLVKVELSGYGLASRGEEEIKILAQLSAIPSVNVLRCEKITCSEISSTGWNPLIYHSGVTIIEIYTSQVHPDVVDRLLGGVQALRKFFLWTSMGLNTTEDRSRIFQVLRQHAKYTLEELDLTWFSSTNERLARASIDDFRDFQMLKKLRVRYSALMSENEDETLPQVPLTSILPPSITEIRLVGPFKSWPRPCNVEFTGETKAIARRDLNDLAALFNGLPALKKQCLPNLVRVDCELVYIEEFEQFGVLQDIRETCMSAGVTVNGLDRRFDREHQATIPPRHLRRRPAEMSLYQWYSPDPS